MEERKGDESWHRWEHTKNCARCSTGADEREHRAGKKKRKEAKEKGVEVQREAGCRGQTSQEAQRTALTTAQYLPLSSCHKFEVPKSLIQCFLRNS